MSVAFEIKFSYKLVAYYLKFIIAASVNESDWPLPMKNLWYSMYINFFS